MEKVRDKYIEDTTLKNSSANTPELLKKKKMLFNHKVWVWYATKFFILKFDTYQKVTTDKKFTKLRGSNTGVRVWESPVPLRGMAQSGSGWDAVSSSGTGRKG